MLFSPIINTTNNVFSLVTHLTLLDSSSINVMDLVNMEQVNQIGNLIWSLKDHMHQHLIENGVSLYPLSTLVSLTNSLIQITAYHKYQSHINFSLSELPILSHGLWQIVTIT